MRMVKGLLLAGVVALAPACSGHKDSEEEVTADPKDEKAEEPAEAAAPAEPAAAPAAPPPAAEAPPPSAPATPAAAAPAAEPEGFTGAKMTRYVRVVAIKVHTLPDKDSPVLGWVKKGDGLDVVVNGDWAKLGPGRYISNKFLSDQPVAPAASAGAPAVATPPAKKGKAHK